MNRNTVLLRRIRFLLAFYMGALLLIGLSTFPLTWEIGILNALVTHPALQLATFFPPLVEWIGRVHDSLQVTAQTFPFLAYGTDWLAFAHIVIGLAIIGTLRDPIKNIWIVEWLMLCCVLVIPLAVIMGPIRGIPFGWTLVDSAFGLFGIIPLYIVRRDILELSRFSLVDSQVK